MARRDTRPSPSSDVLEAAELNRVSRQSCGSGAGHGPRVGWRRKGKFSWAGKKSKSAKKHRSQGHESALCLGDECGGELDVLSVGRFYQLGAREGRVRVSRKRASMLPFVDWKMRAAARPGVGGG